MRVSSVLLCLVVFLSIQSAESAIIKTGDVLDIQVVSYAAFSGRYKVLESGAIEYPLLVEEVVANMSTSELMNRLAFRLARHIDNPLVLISIVKKPEIIVTVLGQVAKPGPVVALDGVTLQEVVQMAGGPNPDADLERIRIVRGKERIDYMFNLESFLLHGNMDSMPALGHDDVVVVLQREHSRKVKVIGAVQKPGMFSIEDKSSLFEMIFLAGGPSEQADLRKVRRFTTKNDATLEEIIDVQSYIDRGEMSKIPLVHEGDVIIVYSKWFDWRTVMTVLNNALLILVVVQTFAGVLK